MYSRMSQAGVQTKNVSARSARSILLYRILKMVAPPIIAMVSWPGTIAS